MKIDRLRLVNFRQHADTVLDFDGGLTGIIGPNGAGKSTILEGIAWALYGTDAARGRKDSIRSMRAGPRAAVRAELDFELGGHRYRVVRGLTSAELFLDGGGAPIANSITGVNEFLRKRLGMSLDEFFNTYFTGQKELSVMAAMGPSERAQFLSRVLGYERLRAAQTLVREQRRVITAEAAGVRAAMPDADAVARMVAEAEARFVTAGREAAASEARRSAAESAHVALVPRWTEAQRERERLQELVGELRVAESEDMALARDLERLTRELGALQSAQEELTTLTATLAPLPGILEELLVLDALAREEGRRQTLLESERALQEELGRLRERRERLETAPQLEEEALRELEEKRRTLEQAQGALDAGRTEWVRDRQEAETRRQALRQQYAELRAQRERFAELGEKGICPTCNQPLGPSYRALLEQLDEQLATLQVDGNYYKARLEQLAEMPTDVRALDDRRRLLADETDKLQRRLSKVQLAVQELAQVRRDVAAKEERAQSIVRDLAAVPEGYDAARHTLLQREAERLRPLEQRASRLGAQAERAPQLRTEHARASGARERTAHRLAALTAQRAALTFSEETFAELRRAHERTMAALRDAELAAVAAMGELHGARTAQETADQARRDLARAQEQLAALTAEKRLHDELDRAYSDMRTDLNQQLRPEIAELASAFLTDLTDGRYTELELDEQYNVIVLEEGIPKPVISGGEEDLANLVLRLAISQMIAERAGQPFSLLILDEVFGSLDDTRRNNVVELLKGLHDRFEQVILITHIEGVREGVDRVITVRYDEERGAAVARPGDVTGGPELPFAAETEAA